MGLPADAELLVQVVDAAIGGDAPPAVVERILRGVLSSLDAVSGQLWLIDHGGALRCEALAGLAVPAEHPLSPSGRLLRPWIQHDLAHTGPPGLTEWAQRQQADTLIAVPVRTRRHDFGRLEMIWSRPAGLAQAELLAGWGSRIAFVLDQNRLRADEELARRLLQAVPAAAMEYDLSGRVQRWNAAARRMFGWCEADVLGRPTRIVPAEVRSEFEQAWSQVKAGGVSGAAPTRRQRHDGKLLDVTSSVVPLHSPLGDVRGVLEVVVDQSEERRKARQFQTLLRVQQILAASPSLSAGGQAGLQTLAELVSCECAELWVHRPPDNPWQLAAAWRKTTAGVQEAVSHCPMAAATDHIEFLEAVRQHRQVLYRGVTDMGCGPLQLAAGRGEAACGVPVVDQQQVIAVLGLHGPDLEEFDDDLRECVQSAAYAFGQFLMRQQGAMELAETRNMLRQAQKMDALGLLTGGIAHDFNNVLTVILSYSEIAGDEIGTAHPAHEMLTEIHHAGQRAAAMTRRLLSFSRRHDEQPVLICVNELVADLERMLRRLIGPSIVLESRLAPDAGPVRADPGQLEQVLVNLIVNARDAMPSGGRISVSTCGVTLHRADLRRYPDSRSGDYVAITVADTGCGMDESTKARIFEPFFTTKEPGRGTGMGLATVAAIVRQCGGFIDVETAAGHGTLMHVFLPRARVTFATQVVDEKSSPPPGGTETILLVEEDHTIRTLMRRIVQVRGYHVLEADGGDEALRVLSEAPRPVSLVLTSPEVVRMGNGEFARRLRAVSPGTQVMLLVDVADDSTADAAGDVVDVLQKPFTSDDLARKIRVVLDERAG